MLFHVEGNEVLPDTLGGSQLNGIPKMSAVREFEAR